MFFSSTPFSFIIEPVFSLLSKNGSTTNTQLIICCTINWSKEICRFLTQILLIATIIQMASVVAAVVDEVLGVQ